MGRRTAKWSLLAAVLVLPASRSEAQTIGFASGNSINVERLQQSAAGERAEQAETRRLRMARAGATTEARVRRERTVSMVYQYWRQDWSFPGDMHTDYDVAGPQLHLLGPNKLIFDLFTGYAGADGEDNYGEYTHSNSFFFLGSMSKEMLHGLVDEGAEPSGIARYFFRGPGGLQTTFFWMGMGAGYRYTDWESLFFVPGAGQDRSDIHTGIVSPGVVLLQFLSTADTMMTGASWTYEGSAINSDVDDRNDSKGQVVTFLRYDHYFPEYPADESKRVPQLGLVAQWNHDTDQTLYPVPRGKDDSAEFAAIFLWPFTDQLALYLSYDIETLRSDSTTQKAIFHLEYNLL